MLPPRIVEQLFSNQWAMDLRAFNALRSIIDGEDLTAEDYKLLHSVDQSEKENIKAFIGKKIEGSFYSSVEENVGFLIVDGPIIPRATWMSRASGLVSLDALRSEFKAMEGNPKIDTIVHLMDTPGGVVQAVSDYASLIFNSNKKTYTWAWEAASAGYWIGSASNSLVLPNTGMVGSVGVVVSLTDYKEQDKKRGIKEIEIVSSQSPNKRPDVDTAEGIAVYQKLVNDLADSFVNDVATFRNVSEEIVLQDFGKGSLVVGKEAVSVGMADRVDDFESFLKSLKNSSQKTYFLKGTNKMELEELKSEHKELHDQVVSDAKEEERKRIKGVESLIGSIKDPLPQVKEAATEYINSVKFDPNISESAIAGKLLEVVTTSQKEALESFMQPRREKSQELAQQIATDDLTETNNEKEKNKNSANQKQIDGMLAARKQRLNKKGK